MPRAEEAEAVDAERRRRAEHERDQRCERSRLEREPERCLHVAVVDRGENHLVVSRDGQLCTFDELNA